MELFYHELKTMRYLEAGDTHFPLFADAASPGAATDWLIQQEEENSVTRVCDEVTRRTSPGQSHLLNQRAHVTAVIRARPTLA
jgi:hypothetical protein